MDSIREEHGVDQEAALLTTYRAFNARHIDRALTAVHTAVICVPVRRGAGVHPLDDWHAPGCRGSLMRSAAGRRGS